MKQPVVCCSPEVMGGTAVFYGTRVPVQTLLDYIEAGDTIDDFLEGFPSVTREHVIAFLIEATPPGTAKFISLFSKSSNACFPRPTLSMMASGSTVQVRSFGFWLVSLL